MEFYTRASDAIRHLLEPMYGNAEMIIAKIMIIDFFKNEYPGQEYSMDEFESGKDISLAYTELGDNNEYPVKVYVNLDECRVKYEITDETGTHMIPELEERYSSLHSLINDFLEFLDFYDLISPFYDYIPEEEE